MFAGPLPATVSAKALEKNHTEFSVVDVKKWVDKHDSIQGRFRFFETFASNSEFYLKVAKPLLSMRTVGSIDVERRIKPIKHTILTKKRNCLSDAKEIVFFCASENLKHIAKAKNSLGKKIYESL